MDYPSGRDRPRNDNWLANLFLAALLIFLPVVGHLILTPIILADDLTVSEKIIWLVVIWVFWFIGPFLYLLFGQRRNRLLGSHHG